MRASIHRAGSLRFFALAALSILVFGALASAYTVRVSVSEAIGSEAKQEAAIIQNNFVSLDYDILNSGSMGYLLRLRLDIYNKTGAAEKPIASIWTKEMPLWPGDRKSASLYWYGANISDNITAKIRAYRANEIADVAEFPLQMSADKSMGAKDIFSAERIRVYDDKIMMRLASSEDAEGVAIYASKYPLGWIFEEERIEKIKKNERMWVTIHYEPSLFFESDAVISIASVASDGGANYSEKAFALKKEEGIMKYVHIAEDMLF